MSARYLRFPYDVVDQENIKIQFAVIAGFPNVRLHTHLAIKAPSEHEFAYVNKKNFHSINVQITCDAQICLTDVHPHKQSGGVEAPSWSGAGRMAPR